MPRTILFATARTILFATARTILFATARTILFVAALTVVAGAAAAASDVPRAIQVVGDSVTLRQLLLPDMSAGVGEDILDRVVVCGLQPGEQRLLTPAEISLRLSEIGIDPRAHGWSWPYPVKVTRRSRSIAAGDLARVGEEAIRRELRLRPGDQATIVPVLPPRPLLAPEAQVRLEAIVRRPPLLGGLWVAEVTGLADDVAVLTSTIRYRVQVTGPVMVARRPIGRHQALREDDAALETRELMALRGEPLRSFEELVGRRAARAASAGTVVTTEWTESIPAVRRGDMITAAVQVGAVRASTRAVALADGAPGDLIIVRTDGRKAEFLARVTGPGRVEVVISP